MRRGLKIAGVKEMAVCHKNAGGESNNMWCSKSNGRSQKIRVVGGEVENNGEKWGAHTKWVGQKNCGSKTIARRHKKGVGIYKIADRYKKMCRALKNGEVKKMGYQNNGW